MASIYGMITRRKGKILKPWEKWYLEVMSMDRPHPLNFHDPRFGPQHILEYTDDQLLNSTPRPEEQELGGEVFMFPVNDYNFF